MKLHPEEMALAQAYGQSHAFESLSEAQVKQIAERGRLLRNWFKFHKRTHNLISVAVLIFIFGVDYWALLRMPRWLLPEEPSTAAIVAVALLAGAIHSYLMYSMSVYSMHEGSAHRWIFVGEGRIAKAANLVASNLARLAACDPEYYTVHHMSHHARFGTELDGEFLNFVRPRRFWLMLLPFGGFLPYSDFLAHRPENYTRSRLITAALTLGFNGAYAYFLYRAFGGLFTIVAMGICFPHFGFYLDRLRQFTEHNLMPLDNKNGSRSLGCGFWGLLVGGGPWGSPCHWEHHLVAGIPWYQQLIVHFTVVGVLTPKQKEQFLIEPVIGFPKLWWRIVREAGTFERGFERV